MKAVNRQRRILAAMLVTVVLLCVMARMSQRRLLSFGLGQKGVQVVFDGHEFRQGAGEGYATVTLLNNTDRTISFPVLRDRERRVAAVL